MSTVKIINVKEIANNSSYASIYKIVDGIIMQGNLEEGFLLYQSKENESLVSQKILFVINLDYTNYINNAVIGVNQAFEILKWIRIRGLLNHCIFESNFDITYWLKNTDDSFLFKSKGISYFQYFYEISDENNTKYIEIQEDSLSFKELFKKTIDIKKIRHEKANWFSLYWNYLLSDNLNNNKGVNRLSLIDSEDIDIQSLRYIYEDFKICNLSKEEKEFVNNTKTNWVNIKLLCIDDTKEWSEFFKYAFNLSTDNIQGVSSNFNFTNIEQTINNFKPNVIFLDLRLLNEKGDVKPNGLSGIVLLKKIITFFPSIPVIITSATDDSETIDYVKNSSGAFGFWQKKGIDSTFSEHYINKEFLKLYSIANRLNNIISSDTRLEIFKLEQLSKFKKQDPVSSLSNKELIIIDTNFWLSNNLADVLFKLREVFNSFAYFTPTSSKIVFDSRNLEIINPCKYKIVITNECMSELFKISKGVFANKEYNLSLKAQYSLDFINVLLNENKIVIVDFKENTYDSQAYADPLIIDFILSNLDGAYYKAIFNGRVFYSNAYSFRQQVIYQVLNKNNVYYNQLKVNRVVLLTNDKGLTNKTKRIMVNANESIVTLNEEDFIKLL